MPIGTPLRRPTAFLVLFALAAALVLASCDAAGPGGQSAEEGPVEMNADTVQEELRMAPIPEGARLLSLPHERDTLGGGGGPSLEPDAVTNEGNGAPNGFSEDASPYGCLISTLRSREAVEAGKERYRYSDVYLHFPPGLLRRADEQQSQQTMFLLQSGRAPSYAQPGEEARPGAGPGGGVRMAQCRLPGGSEKLRKAARRMVREQLQRFSGEDSWVKDVEKGQDASLASGGAPASGVQASNTAAGASASDEAATRGGCLVYTNVYFCTDVYANGELKKSSCKLERSYCSVRASGSGGGGTGGISGGDDMDRCDSYDGGPASQLCSDGPGGGGDVPDEENEYKKVDVHPPATPDEVMDHIREVCAGVSAVDIPLQNDPDDFSGYFEASVRKSLNAHRSNLSKYVRDRKVTGGSSAHPQLSRVTDGYAEGLRIDGRHVPNVVTSIIESKFTHDVSGQLGYNQSTTHIDDLAKAYDLSPTGDLLYAPTYVIASNSQYEDVEGLGRYGSGQERDLPDYGAMQGVNVMHLRVTKSAGGQFYLEGDLLGSPAKVIDWIGDVLGDEKTPFRVSCSP